MKAIRHSSEPGMLLHVGAYALGEESTQLLRVERHGNESLWDLLGHREFRRRAPIRRGQRRVGRRCANPRQRCDRRGDAHELPTREALHTRLSHAGGGQEIEIGAFDQLRPTDAELHQQLVRLGDALGRRLVVGEDDLELEEVP